MSEKLDITKYAASGLCDLCDRRVEDRDKTYFFGYIDLRGIPHLIIAHVECARKEKGRFHWDSLYVKGEIPASVRARSEYAKERLLEMHIERMQRSCADLERTIENAKKKYTDEKLKRELLNFSAGLLNDNDFRAEKFELKADRRRHSAYHARKIQYVSRVLSSFTRIGEIMRVNVISTVHDQWKVYLSCGDDILYASRTCATKDVISKVKIALKRAKESRCSQ